MNNRMIDYVDEPFVLNATEAREMLHSPVNVSKILNYIYHKIKLTADDNKSRVHIDVSDYDITTVNTIINELKDNGYTVGYALNKISISF